KLELPDHLTGANGGRVESLVSFLGHYLHARVQLALDLRMALRRQTEGDLTVDEQKDIQESITQLSQELVEESTESVFGKFTSVIVSRKYSRRR
ncbi:hypothetical protein BS17DRAFT_791345, partial [Gyrodon lividus]